MNLSTVFNQTLYTKKLLQQVGFAEKYKDSKKDYDAPALAWKRCGLSQFSPDPIGFSVMANGALEALRLLSSRASDRAIIPSWLGKRKQVPLADISESWELNANNLARSPNNSIPVGGRGYCGDKRRNASNAPFAITLNPIGAGLN